MTCFVGVHCWRRLCWEHWLASGNAFTDFTSSFLRSYYCSHLNWSIFYLFKCLARRFCSLALFLWIFNVLLIEFSILNFPWFNCFYSRKFYKFGLRCWYVTGVHDDSVKASRCVKCLTWLSCDSRSRSPSCSCCFHRSCLFASVSGQISAGTLLALSPTYRPLTNAHALRSPRSILSRCHRGSRPKLQLLDFFSIKPCRLLTFQVWVARFWSERRLIRRLQPLNSTESRYRISSRCCRLRDLISGCSCDAASIWLEATGSD